MFCVVNTMFVNLFLDVTNIIGVGNVQELDLGIVVKYVINGIAHYLSQIYYVSKLKSKLEAVPAMTTDEVKQVRIFLFTIENFFRILWKTYVCRCYVTTRCIF